jgi:hypothetical protein
MWRLIVTLFLITIGIVASLVAPAMYLYQADGRLAKYRRPVSNDAAVEQKAMVNSSSIYSEASDLPDDRGARRRRGASPVHLRKNLDDLIASLRNRNACIEDYLEPGNIERKVAQARRHLKALDDLEHARKQIKKSCSFVGEDGYDDFFNVWQRPYRAVEKKLKRVRKVMKKMMYQLRMLYYSQYLNTNMLMRIGRRICTAPRKKSTSFPISEGTTMTSTMQKPTKVGFVGARGRRLQLESE